MSEKHLLTVDTELNTEKSKDEWSQKWFDKVADLAKISRKVEKIMFGGRYGKLFIS